MRKLLLTAGTLFLFVAPIQPGFAQTNNQPDQTRSTAPTGGASSGGSTIMPGETPDPNATNSTGARNPKTHGNADMPPKDNTKCSESQAHNGAQGDAGFSGDCP